MKPALSPPIKSGLIVKKLTGDRRNSLLHLLLQNLRLDVVHMRVQAKPIGICACACVYVCGCVLVMAFPLVKIHCGGQTAPHCPVLWCVSFGISTQHILAAISCIESCL